MNHQLFGFGFFVCFAWRRLKIFTIWKWHNYSTITSAVRLSSAEFDEPKNLSPTILRVFRLRASFCCCFIFIVFWPDYCLRTHNRRLINFGWFDNRTTIIQFQLKLVYWIFISNVKVSLLHFMGHSISIDFKHRLESIVNIAESFERFALKRIPIQIIDNKFHFLMVFYGSFLAHNKYQNADGSRVIIAYGTVYLGQELPITRYRFRYTNKMKLFLAALRKLLDTNDMMLNVGFWIADFWWMHDK